MESNECALHTLKQIEKFIQKAVRKSSEVHFHRLAEHTFITFIRCIKKKTHTVSIVAAVMLHW